MQHYPYPVYSYYRQIPIEYGSEDQRFFPLLLPFVAGLAIGPLLFNRPFYPPYPMPYPAPYPVPYGGYPVMPQNQMFFPQTSQMATTENINIYTK